MWPAAEEGESYSHLGLLSDCYVAPSTEGDELKGAEPQTFKREPSDLGTALPWWWVRSLCNPFWRAISHYLIKLGLLFALCDPAFPGTYPKDILSQVLAACTRMLMAPLAGGGGDLEGGCVTVTWRMSSAV